MPPVPTSSSSSYRSATVLPTTSESYPRVRRNKPENSRQPSADSSAASQTASASSTSASEITSGTSTRMQFE